ncbi:MAG: asparagine synthase (glutamine-hydrolyzing) [Acidobacteria bacterium RBG_16_64_8]|nr:MAG: asparagine synthase (glutamine-hydrolyzing) [Acidobacteria bacterium RBG_16_64_8]
MCGIVGEIGPAACNREQLLRMMGMLTHRGPDEAGLLVAEGVALGHLRLSIVDPEHGQQPMSTLDGRHWVVFNGEIFNHVELRQELESAGHAFRTRCDTEVLLNAFREWGAGCLERFNGQWAFALWNRETGDAFLARDRFGVRPLFYSVLPDGRTLLFASEMKAILADSRVSHSWDLQALRDIFISWGCEAERTPLRSIRLLPPGSWMKIAQGRIELGRWWDVDYSPEVVDWSRTDDSWHEEVRATLNEACRLRLRADVPVGTYLSGGLDSSIISWLSKAHQPRLQTFSVAFSDAAYDESSFQDLVAGEIGTEHHRLSIRRETIAEHFRDTIWHTETPMHRTAPVPLMRLSRMVRDAGMKVVLTGEGADEVFGGYDQFKENKIRRFWARCPDSAWRKRLLDRLESNVPRSGPRTRAFWYAFYGQGLDGTTRPGYSHHPRWRNGLSLLPLLREHGNGQGPDAADWIEQVEHTAPERFASWNPLAQAQYWEIRQFLAGYLLSSQGDRVSLANGVEGRYPFLDAKVFELSRRMPPDQKLRVLREKYVLKQTFRHDLPERIVKRQKYPYRAPDALALYRGDHRQLLLDSLNPDAARRRGLFHVEAVRKLMDRVHRSEEPTARDNIALVLVYSSHLFHDLFVEAAMRPADLPALRTCIDLVHEPNKVECHS